jgi:hypothetical protein
MRTLLAVSTALVLVLAASQEANAASITGELDFAGGFIINAGSLANWFLTVTPLPSGPNEAFIIGSTVRDGDVGGVLVAALAPGNLLFETNLSFATTPAGVPLNVNLFEHACLNPPACTNLGTPAIDYVLTFISTCPQLGPLYTCLEPLPYGFIQNSDSVTLALQMSGTVFDEATPTIKNTWTGSWSTQIAGAVLCHADHSLTPPCDATSFFGIIEGGGSISNSYSGTKITATSPAPVPAPEPATLLTCGIGATWLARRYVRRESRLS